MAIIVKLDDALHDHRMTLTELAEKVGLTLANLSILKTGKARAVRFSTLNAICEALQCQPGDLLQFAPGPAADEEAEAPLVGRAAPDSESHAVEEQGAPE
jgi:putative transcriptional regulator